MKIILLSLSIFFMSKQVVAQSFDRDKGILFINKYLEKLEFEGNISLATDTYQSIFGSSNRKVIYDSLSKFFSISQLDKSEDICYNKSLDFKWQQESIPNVKVLSDDSVRHYSSISATKVIIVERRKCFFGKKKTIQYPQKHLFIRTSIPIFFDNYCLIKISESTGNTTGSQCLYLYQFNDNTKDWDIIKSVNCLLM